MILVGVQRCTSDYVLGSFGDFERRVLHSAAKCKEFAKLHGKIGFLKCPKSTVGGNYIGTWREKL